MDTIHLPIPKPLMIAHRGLSGLETENTCVAFEAAGNHGYFGIETDVHRTLDGHFVVIHDDDTLRVSGANLSVEGSTLAQLRALALQDWSGQPGRRELIIPTLQEYIQTCKKHEKTAVLELKNPLANEDLDSIVKIIEQEEYLPRTVFISFHLANLVYLRPKLPTQPMQYLIEIQVPEDLIHILNTYQLDLDIDHTLLTPALSAACKAAGKKNNVWTVNTPAEAQRVINLGVDYITTNILE